MLGTQAIAGFAKPVTRWLGVGIALLGFTLWSGAASASTVYVAPGMPDIYAGAVTWDYGDEYGGGRSDSTGAGDYRLFQIADGLPNSYIDPAGSGFTIYQGSLAMKVGIDAVRGIDTLLTAANTVDGTNNLVIGGTFSPFLGATPTTLLTATVSLLKDPIDNPDSLQFNAVVTGGDLAADFGGINGEFVIFANATGIGGAWTGVTFNLADSGSADFAAPQVPVPGSLALLLLGMVGLRFRFGPRGAGRSSH